MNRENVVKVCCMMGACLRKTLVERKVSDCVHILWNKTFVKIASELKLSKNIRVIV